MKRKWLALIALLGLLLSIPARAETGTVKLPASVEIIEAQAFYGDKSIRKAVLPDSVREIRAQAFAGSGLTEINLPDSIQSIDDTAFDGLGSVSITANRGSMAYEWAVSHGFMTADMKLTAVAQSAVVTEGAPVLITAVASGATSREAEWQWQSSADGHAWSDVTENGDAVTLRFAASRETCARQYRCVVTDPYGTWTSNAVSMEMKLRVTLVEGSLTPRQDDPLKFRVEAYDTDRFQWQTSEDSGATWTDSDRLGSETATLSLFADLNNGDCRYRCRVTSAQGQVYYSNVVTFAPSPVQSIDISHSKLSLYMGDSAQLTATVLPADAWIIEPTWTSSNSDVAYVQNGLVTAVGPGTATITATTYDEKFSASCEVRVDYKYTALLVSESDFYWASDNSSDHILRNKSDVSNMAAMLRGVKTPTGGSYAVTTRNNTTAEELRALIRSTFAGNNEYSVSLFFIATHGDTSKTASAGALAMASTDKNHPTEYLPISELRDCFMEVPGRVIVIIQSCGSGAAIYANAGSSADSGQNPDAFNESVIRAFSRGDPGVTLPAGEGSTVANTGELRVANKFYVLTASDYAEVSFGIEHPDDSDEKRNFFPDWLIEGVGYSGNMPADQLYEGNRDGAVDLYELYSYISGVGDNREFVYRGKSYYQHVQVYPAYTRYELFR